VAQEDPFPLLDENVVWEVPMFDQPEDSFNGHAGVAEFFRRWLGTWENYELTIEDVIETPDGRVVTLFREAGRGRTSGAPVELRVVGVWTVANGRVSHYRGYTDREEGLRAAGLG
jgi:ketosteroid isomerase-like protein